VSAIVHHGDCLVVMPTLDADSFDAIVTDPPYGLSQGKKGGAGQTSENLASPAGRSRATTGFMGKAWDATVPGIEFWREALRVAKPGAHLVAFGGTRTYHRLACAIEDAGWEIRDCLSWLYGSGFPKSLDVSKAIDKRAGIDRNEAPHTRADTGFRIQSGGTPSRPAESDAARQWDGWGTALKPAWESIILARKPTAPVQELHYIVANLARLEAQLWSLLPANVAANAFGLSPAEHDVACGSAQWSADERASTWADLFGGMDTWRSVSVMTTCLSTVSSWSATLAESSVDTSTSITGTATSPTIDWRTLRFCLSELTPHSIIRAAINRPGSWWNALPAAAVFHAAVESMSATRALSALATVIEQARTARRDEDAPDFSTAWEPIILARKPLIGTVAANVLQHGTGALNIDATRVKFANPEDQAAAAAQRSSRDQNEGRTAYGRFENGEASLAPYLAQMDKGRWPANVVLDEEAAEVLDGQSGTLARGHTPSARGTGGLSTSGHVGQEAVRELYHDLGGASRFFYTAKASASERHAGLDHLPRGEPPPTRADDAPGGNNPRNTGARRVANSHPTVKPLALMQWLCKLVTPPGGLILDPFTGSGTTGRAAVAEGFRFVGIEREAEYVEIARARIADYAPLFGGAA
jgi:DNA modification methylase